VGGCCIKQSGRCKSKKQEKKNTFFLGQGETFGKGKSEETQTPGVLAGPGSKANLGGPEKKGAKEKKSSVPQNSAGKGRANQEINKLNMKGRGGEYPGLG